MKKFTESDRIKGTLIYLYLGKLSEFGLIERGDKSSMLTPKGFDLAIDAYDKGVRLTKKEISVYLDSVDESSNIKPQLLQMIMHLQEIGFDKMKEEVESVKANMQ